MVNAKRVEEKNRTIVVISGEIDEMVDFAKLIPAGAKRLEIVCDGVQRINSCGVRAWYKFFREQRYDGTVVRFHKLSPAIVGCLNLLAPLFAPREVKSYQVHLYCACCRKVQVALQKTSAGLKGLESLKNTSCTQCGKTMVIDEGQEQVAALEAMVARYEWTRTSLTRPGASSI